MVALLMLAGAAPDVSLGLVEFRQGRFAEAFRDWAAAGDARGALYIGVLYDSGLGVEQDQAAALRWYERAAREGSAVGAFNAGVMYDAGLGTAKNPGAAARWYGIAAAQRFGRAEFNLGLLTAAGIGVAKDRRKAVALFRRAAADGVTAARAHLAALGDVARAPARPGQVPDMAEFQRARQMITSRSAAEAAKAAAVFRQSANRRDALAEYDLGYCYERGLGVAVDSRQALDWYRRAAADSKDPAIRSAAQAGIDFLQRVQARAASP